MGIELKDKLIESSAKINGKTFKHRIYENKGAGNIETWVYPEGGYILKNHDGRYTAIIWLRTDTGGRMIGRETRNTLEEAAEVVIGAAEDLNMKDAKMNDDYGWEIPSEKAWQAFESLKELLGVDKLLGELEQAVGTDTLVDAGESIARDEDFLDEMTIPAKKAKADPELAISYFEALGVFLTNEEMLDELARYLGNDELAENLAYICRVGDIEIPELEHEVEEEEIEVDMDDALWVNPDNNAPTAGRLTFKDPIPYGDYLILTRKDGLFDVYTVGDYDLVGTAFKSVDEAKRNIDEGRTEENFAVIEEDDEFNEDDEFEAAMPDPDRKDINYKGFRLKKQPSGRWLVSSAGEGIGERKDLTETPNFAAAVDYLFKHTTAPKPTGSDKMSMLIKAYMKDTKIKDYLTGWTVKPGSESKVFNMLLSEKGANILCERLLWQMTDDYFWQFLSKYKQKFNLNAPEIRILKRDSNNGAFDNDQRYEILVDYVDNENIIFQALKDYLFNYMDPKDLDTLLGDTAYLSYAHNLDIPEIQKLH